MNINSLKDTHQDWKLYSYMDSGRLEELSGGESTQVHAERIYAYAKYFSRGRITVNAWYYPTFDPYGEYPYEIQFFFATSGGDILKEVSIFEPDADAQLQTVTESLDNIEAFFWKRLSMKLTDILPVLGVKVESPPNILESDAVLPKSDGPNSLAEAPGAHSPVLIEAPVLDRAGAATRESKGRIRKFLGSN